MSDEAVRRAWRAWVMDPVPEKAQAWAAAQARTMAPPKDGPIDEALGAACASIRARKAVERLGVKTLVELARKTENEVLAVRNCGVVTLGELRKVLHAHGAGFDCRLGIDLSVIST